MVETIDWNHWLNKARCNKKNKIKRSVKYLYGYEDDDGIILDLVKLTFEKKLYYIRSCSMERSI